MTLGFKCKLMRSLFEESICTNKTSGSYVQSYLESTVEHVTYFIT